MSSCSIPMQMIAAIVVLATSLVSGACCMRRVCFWQKSCVEKFALTLLLGFAINTPVLLTLALLGAFFPLYVSAVTLSVAFLLIVFTHKKKAAYLSTVRRCRCVEFIVFIAVLCTVIFSCVVGSEDYAVNRDPGVYSTTAMVLAKTGRLGWIDPLASYMPMEFAKPFYEDINNEMRERPRWMFWPGFYLRDVERGTIEPQFLHVYEPWMAIGCWLHGPRGVIDCVSVWSGLFLLLLYSFASWAFGWRVGLLALLLLICNPAFLWYMRTVSNETMSMCFLWGSVLIFSRSLQRPSLGTNALFVALALLFLAMLGKFAMWLYLPAFGLALGYYIGRRRIVGMRYPALTLFCLQWLAIAYGFTFAGWYTWGSAYVSAIQYGCPLWKVLLFFSAAALLSVWFGRLFAAAVSRYQISVLLRLRPALTWVLGIVLPVLFLFQLHEMTMLLSNDPDSTVMRWLNQVPLGQLSAYLSPVVLCCALVGVPFLLFYVSPRNLLLPLLLLFGSALIYRSGIDAMHPWCVRRWLVVIIPVFCLSAAVLPRMVLMSYRRLSAYKKVYPAYFCLILVAAFFGSAKIKTICQNKGFFASANKLAVALKGYDLVVAQPSNRVVSLAGYLWAEHGIDMRTLQKNEADWRMALTAFKYLRDAGKKICYVSDVNSFTDPHFNFVCDDGQRIPFEWTVLNDGLMRPREQTETISGTYRIWEIEPDKIPFGWYYPEKWTTAPALSLPYIEDLTRKAQTSESLIRWLYRDSIGTVHGAWLGEHAQINIGVYADYDAETSGGLEVVLDVRTGRDVPELKLDCGIYLDLTRSYEKMLKAVTVANQPEKVVVRIPYSEIKKDSIVSIISETTETGRSIPLGHAQGILLEKLIIDKY